ncbi:steroidogenic acute regulatory protein-like isoform X2 [Coccinella septempunctata]|uniref:steroidogenic acute regulatory protein-like isoform X2 n=1 Tax=Coccinella septempunctata TaxID=41139 RepID=UPI001D08B4DA|nr:steroidogenic acute regulatory protein-like isoform X2 [Coccinella septempunctata]
MCHVFQLQGENIWQALDSQINHYNIKTSFFDILFLAICRFILLGFFYGILQINHWIIIFVTTAATSAFCIVKVFFYNWQQTPQPVFEVLSILVSFILAWGEAWFFDYRVIPQESYANQIIVNTTNERSPLIQHYLRGAAPSRYTESIENFHSPMNTPEGSLYRFGLEDNPVLGRFLPSVLTRNEMSQYEIAARDLMEESKEMLRSERWTAERETDDIVAYSMCLPSGHTIFKISAIFNTSPRNMLTELYHEVENIPNWNPALLEAQRIQIIDDQTDIIYQLAAAGAGGLVSSRDFVSLRRWVQLDESFLLATKYTQHPNVPKTSKYVRGENVSCFLLEQGENQNQCRKTFILNTNLKGWIPQTVVNLALVDTLFSYMKCLKMHILKKYPSE